MIKYKLDLKHVDKYEEGDYALWLPYGFRFDDDIVHTRSYDTMRELKQSAKRDVIPCNCNNCINQQ